MRELSLHILDIVENGLGAGATLIEIGVVERKTANRMEIWVRDNGRGIPAHILDEVTNPFFTTRKTRRVGLGLSLLQEAAKRCNGEFRIRSEEGSGTEVFASFELDHIDRAPLGDVAVSLISLIVGNPEVDFLYSHELDGTSFRMDTREVKQGLEDVAIHHPQVVRHLTEFIRESLAEMRTAGSG